VVHTYFDFWRIASFQASNGHNQPSEKFPGKSFVKGAWCARSQITAKDASP